MTAAVHLQLRWLLGPLFFPDRGDKTGFPDACSQVTIASATSGS